MVEGIESLKSELQLLGFCEEEALVQAQIHIDVPRSADVANRAGAERVRSGICDVARVKPLNICGRRGGRVHAAVHVVNWTVATRTFRQGRRPNSVGIRGITVEAAPATELIQGQSIPSVGGDDSADFPIADDSTERWAEVLAELFASPERQLVGHVVG